jgi:hypothetical protein
VFCPIAIGNSGCNPEPTKSISLAYYLISLLPIVSLPPDFVFCLHGAVDKEILMEGIKTFKKSTSQTTMRGEND